MKKIFFLSFLILFVFFGNFSAHADLIWSFDLIPPDGNISGAPGSTIGWGYTITNSDSQDWLDLTAIDADPFLYGTPTSIFDLPIIAPGGTLTVPYDELTGLGLYQLTWDSDAPIGFVNSGTFTLHADWYNGDPLSGGVFDETANDESQPYSATVVAAAVPEPTTILFLVSGLVALLGFRRRYKWI